MVERRKPLVLTSTKALISSVLGSSTTRDQTTAAIDRTGPGSVDEATSILIPAGILRLSNDLEAAIAAQKLASLDDSALVGLPTSVLKKLSITSGSLVFVKNVEMSIQRLAQAFVIDPPSTHEHLPDNKFPISQSPRAMAFFPSCRYPQVHNVPLDQEVAYLSPLLAFNLSLHIACIKSLVRQGKDTLASLFEVKVKDAENDKGSEATFISLRLEPCAELPRYASHLRIAFVKIPECGTLESLKASSYIEAEERQGMIDLALHNYFEKDRYVARGDLLCIHISWNCKSDMCIPCSHKMQNASDDMIYFKVMAMEPSGEPVLRVNRTKTALVLGGSTSSAVPPDMLISSSKGFVPLQGDTVKILASILTPPLCPSALSSKFRVAVLLYGLSGCGKRTVVKYVASRLGLHVVEYNCHNLMSSSEKKTSIALAEAFKAAQRYAPAVLLLRHFDVFRNLVSQMGSPLDQVGVSSEVASVIKEYTEPVSEEEIIYCEKNSDGDSQMKAAESIRRHPLLLVAASDSSEGLPPTIRRCFTHEISMGPLTEEQRAEMLSQTLHHVSGLLPNAAPDDLIKDMVGQTSGFMPRDMCALIADAAANLIPRQNIQFDKVEMGKLGEKISISCKSEQDNKPCDNTSRVLSKEDLTAALGRSKKRNASALGTPKVPNVKWEDVGGLEDVKKSILDTVQLPLLHKNLFSSGLRKRSGVLLYGPPGTGKTLLAKAVATECTLNFLSVKGPELINMYIGESEKNVRDIFQKARSARPCVIFFDELDSLAPARGASGDSGGVMDRVVSQMLAEIDGLNDSMQDLFIIGASNRPDLIDTALLRPGRFDKLLYVGVNSDPSYRERVLKALTRKFKLHEGVSLYSIAKKCPPNFTGADMYALCADAWFHAAKRKVLSPTPDSTCADDQAASVVVEYDDFVKALGELSPSLSLSELKKYELLRDRFEGGSTQH
ncbi:peroxisome biogenesis protein 6 isoform X2 [Diospyros lotus]|uniref:peroxisome biogenesis protein 6 isoform X2 n=1 Tax=Diospyros lotus TaxID=55363 RepID=UPI00224EC3A0|nr:peroxisome biogenesis protein 6 isoform X2 [Diospyros lotus]